MFDLLTGLLDSWSLWNRVAGSEEAGLRWRQAYLRLTYSQGSYVPYLSLVAEAAQEAGLPATLAEELHVNWLSLAPWPEVHEVLTELATRVPLGVLTNCSETLGTAAALRASHLFSSVITAESVGVYKPHPRCYLAAAAALQVEPRDVLFVAGSAYDIIGATAVGMDVFWHNQGGLSMPAGLVTPPGVPLAESRSLRPLLSLV